MEKNVQLKDVETLQVQFTEAESRVLVGTPTDGDTTVRIAFSFALRIGLQCIFFPLHYCPCNYEPKQSPILEMRTPVSQLGVYSMPIVEHQHLWEEVSLPAVLAGLECSCKSCEQETNDELDLNIENTRTQVYVTLELVRLQWWPVFTFFV